MSNFVYLANGDVFNMNIEHFNKIEHFTDVSDNIITPTIMLPTMTPEIIQPTMMQPTMTPENMQPTMMQPTMMQPTMMQPTMMQPTMTPEIMQPTTTPEIMQTTITPTTMTPEMRTEQQRLDETLLRSQTMEFELNTSIQNANEAANQFMSNLTRN
jgi:hypothetical protein